MNNLPTKYNFLNFQEILLWESGGTGVQFSNIIQTQSVVSISTVMIMMLADTILYLFLACIFVWLSSNGRIRRKVYRMEDSDLSQMNEEGKRLLDGNYEDDERVYQNLRVSILLNGLKKGIPVIPHPSLTQSLPSSKVFKSGKKSVHAVDGLSFRAYEGEIFALLGKICMAE
jgi:ABC-type glutathione transport system ATPase component